MTPPFVQRFRVRYSDLDSNGHVANVTYLKYSTDTRVGYLLANGVTMESMRTIGYGPIVFREELTYFKELVPPEEVAVHYWVKWLHDDGTRFGLCSEIYKANGELSARVDIEGAFMNLARRKLDKPPPETWKLMQALLLEDSAE